MSSHQAEGRKKQVARSSRVTKVCANKHLEAEQSGKDERYICFFAATS